ncbi:MAG: M28 family peptidase [Fimbriimonadaceae bacterium]|nr:M28 family peptidase [Chthonomonadaceae bacterium]MCO5295306.1 M28 family peptidase [Fimbriimonadaceae bacterium]
MIRQTLAAAAIVLGASWAAAQSAAWDTTLTPARQAVLDRVDANSLRGHLSFIASDLLEGRGTPSRGLDLAAEYIAAQFRRAGLEPGGDDGYFQTAEVSVRGSSEPGKARNVVGILRGTDPALKDTCVLVSAHYDHLGMRATGEGDTIFNGANDDGSGTVSVIELAWALAKTHPKRSIVFVTYYGEERGLLGSRYFAQHPPFPLDKMVAMVNLEHVGRTDDTEGPRLKAVSMTGFDYSDLGQVFRAAGEKVGVEVQKHPVNSDAFFGRSDNQALADAGVPAHTLCTTFIFPDYHKVSDHWDKVDFENMAVVDRMVALGLMALADSTQVPHWSENPRAARYREAWKGLHGGGENR